MDVQVLKDKQIENGAIPTTTTTNTNTNTNTTTSTMTPMLMVSPEIRGMLGDKGDSTDWLDAVSKFPNGVPRFESRAECLDFMIDYNTYHGGSNPTNPNLMHIFTMLTTWVEIEDLLLPQIERARLEPSFAESVPKDVLRLNPNQSQNQNNSSQNQNGVMSSKDEETQKNGMMEEKEDQEQQQQQQQQQEQDRQQKKTKYLREFGRLTGTGRRILSSQPPHPQVHHESLNDEHAQIPILSHEMWHIRHDTKFQTTNLCTLRQFGISQHLGRQVDARGRWKHRQLLHAKGGTIPRGTRRTR